MIDTLLWRAYVWIEFFVDVLIIQSQYSVLETKRDELKLKCTECFRVSIFLIIYSNFGTN